MQKYGHIGTFPMGETGPHIAILVLGRARFASERGVPNEDTALTRGGC